MEEPMHRTQAHAENTAYQEPSETDLKAIEFELALGAADIVADGFEASIKNACETCDLTFVFNLPVFDDAETQRVAAVAWRDEDDAVALVFVMLAQNGRSVRIDAQCDCLPHAASVASAWFDLTTI